MCQRSGSLFLDAEHQIQRQVIDTRCVQVLCRTDGLCVPVPSSQPFQFPVAGRLHPERYPVAARSCKGTEYAREIIRRIRLQRDFGTAQAEMSRRSFKDECQPFFTEQ